MSIASKRLLYMSVVVLILVGGGLLLWRGLSLNPSERASTLISKPVPKFNLPTVLKTEQRFTNKEFIGHVSLLNVWATWCVTCLIEHPILMDIARSKKVKLYGLNYKDNLAAARKMLNKYGDPYVESAYDKMGNVAIDFGVYGTPETFLIDKKGIIRYKVLGAVTPDVWKEKLLPLINKLNQS